MTPERIIYTAHTGGVVVCCPAEWAIDAMAQGNAWAHHPRGYWYVQVARQIARGVDPRAAERFARAMEFGGVSRRDAIEIIAARDCGHMGTQIEIVDISDIPTDRTYRDAWRRSANGGPIVIDETIAQQIDEQRMWRAYESA